MEDIFHWCREGNSIQVRLWLDDTEHDMNQGYGAFFLSIGYISKTNNRSLLIFWNTFLLWNVKICVGIGTPILDVCVGSV